MQKSYATICRRHVRRNRNFVRYHQKELRAKTYSNFVDALLTDNADPRDVGQK